MNQLILGDNLEVLCGIAAETVDLIYLDPPFFSNRTYEVIWGDAGELRSFQDRWSGGIDHYISWLKERVIEMHRILKPTGSLFLHCDWHANSEIRVDILNKIFGIDNFRGEIIWQRHNAHNDAKKKLAVLKDTIWYYSKSEKFTYHPIYSGYSEAYTGEFYRYDDQDGQGLYRLSDMGSPNPRPNMMYEWMGFSYPVKGWRYEKATMQKLHDEGKIYYPKDNKGNYNFNKIPRLKRYLSEQKGTLLGDMWTDINNVQAHAKERIGYPTQKPLALLRRIIEMASNEGDMVLDPFMGGGTTVTAAAELKRHWIGIDQSVQAVKVTELRLMNARDLFSESFVIQLHQYDYDTLRYQNAFAFETWIIEQYGGTPNTRQRGDLGIDGKTRDGVPIQVKRSDDIGRNVIDNFHSAIMRDDKVLYERNKSENRMIGVIIAFSFSKGAIQEVARLKNRENISIELVTVAEIVPISKKPILSVQFNDLGVTKKAHREIELIAAAESASGIEFFAWDFNFNAVKGFNAEVLLDKEGNQIYQFKPGAHTIAVKVVDNDGLENIELIHLKVNGGITSHTQPS